MVPELVWLLQTEKPLVSMKDHTATAGFTNCDTATTIHFWHTFLL